MEKIQSLTKVEKISYKTKLYNNQRIVWICAENFIYLRKQVYQFCCSLHRPFDKRLLTKMEKKLLKTKTLSFDSLAYLDLLICFLYTLFFISLSLVFSYSISTNRILKKKFLLHEIFYNLSRKWRKSFNLLCRIKLKKRIRQCKQVLGL